MIYLSKLFAFAFVVTKKEGTAPSVSSTHGCLVSNLLPRVQLKNRILRGKSRSSHEDTTPLKTFQEYQNRRIDEANQVHASIDDLFTCEISNDCPRLLLPPTVSFDELEDLMNGRKESSSSSSSSSSSNTNTRKGRMQEIYHSFQVNGGCLLVQFQPHDSSSNILQSMWSNMNSLFDINDQTIQLPTEFWNQQFLPSPSTGETKQSSGGYEYIQTFLNEKKEVVPASSMHPYTKQNNFSWDHHTHRYHLDHQNENEITENGIQDSFQLLGRVGTVVASVLTAGACKKEDPKHAQKFVEDIIDDYICSNHRLCQYLPVTQNIDLDSQTSVNTLSLLRSHTDWSIVTCIPISQTPGLLIYNPSAQQWMAPDMIVNPGYQLLQQEQRLHYNYCLVMAGKSLELMLGRGDLACIHQVVPPTLCSGSSSSSSSSSSNPPQRKAQQQRQTAPFFLRTKESISYYDISKTKHLSKSIKAVPSTTTTTRTTAAAADDDTNNTFTSSSSSSYPSLTTNEELDNNNIRMIHKAVFGDMDFFCFP